jgi:tRNA1Val (adenine37-N6)-methyltransferase
MGNNYFRFKEFTIHQDKSAMKVCTDACLFGAFVAEVIQKLKGKSQKEEAVSGHSTFNIQNILDIGAGTGLLSLVLAQKVDANIDAVEMDDQAFEQAVENVSNSPWRHRVKVHHSTIQQYDPTIKYDFIISNPPFFQNDLKSDNDKRNLALHSEALSLEELIQSIQRLLHPVGSFAILLPFHRSAYFEKLAMEHQYFLQQKVVVRQSEKHPAFRSMLLYSSTPVSVQQQEVIIKPEGEYSPAFVQLLKDYYLYL